MKQTEFESTNDATDRWLSGLIYGSLKTVRLAIVSEATHETRGVHLTPEDVLGLAQWLIDAYEEMGFEFPGLDRV